MFGRRLPFERHGQCWKREVWRSFGVNNRKLTRSSLISSFSFSCHQLVNTVPTKHAQICQMVLVKAALNPTRLCGINSIQIVTCQTSELILSSGLQRPTRSAKTDSILSSHFHSITIGDKRKTISWATSMRTWCRKLCRPAGLPAAPATDFPKTRRGYSLNMISTRHGQRWVTESEKNICWQPSRSKKASATVQISN